MIKNYIKIAWRSILKYRFISFINIAGLSVGIAFLLLTIAYIWGELQVNAGIKDHDRVYLLQSKWKDPGMGMDFTSISPMGKALRQNYPNLVEDYYHHDGLAVIVSHGDKRFEEGLQLGDSTFLNLFGFEVLHGDRSTALNKPDAIVITANKAIKYFGRTDVVGEVLTLKSFNSTKQDFEVTAVLKDLPYNTVTNYSNSSIEMFLSTGSLKFFGRDKGFDAWSNVYVVNYVKLKKGVKPADLEEPFAQLLKLNTNADVQKNLKPNLTPVREYYLFSNNRLVIKMIYTLAFVALFILLMAVINFINVTIGGSMSRLKEIGVRKVLGGSKRQIILQHLTESILLVAFAVMIALVTYFITRSLFSDMLGRQLPVLSAFPIGFLLIPIGLIFIIGLMAGLYPAFILSAQPSLESLKGKLKTVKEKVAFRYSLITVQFVTAIVVFITAIVIQKQVAYFFSSNLGYDKEHVITATLPRDWTPQGVKHMQTVRNEFAAMPEVVSATFSFEIPNGASSSNGNIVYKASQDSTQGVNAISLITDEHYAETYKIPMLAGQFLDVNNPVKIVINKTAAKLLGWNDPQQAVGQQLRMQGNPQPLTISGIVKDFHFGTMHSNIRPLFFVHVNAWVFYRYMSFRVKPGNTQQKVAALQQKWSTLFADAPFNYLFMDEALSKLYKAEIQMKKASTLATVIALAIVLMGVLSLVTQSISRRMKEVGIRKVLGASQLQVMYLFLKEFSLLLVLANLIAWPVTYIIVNKWLNNYAYKIGITITPFLLVGFSVAGLVVALIFIRSFKASITNPITSLRSE